MSARARLSRRSVLSMFAAGATFAVGGGLLAGCAERKSGKGNAEDEDALAKLLPDYTEYSIVKPDLPAAKYVLPGFTKYPTDLVRALTEKPVTSGKEITAMTPLWGPIPPGVGSNSFFDANAERLGAQIRFQIVNGNDYGEKLSAILGAGDVPELLCIPKWNSDYIGGFNEAVGKLFEDLTPYLSGGNVKPYPLLANLPTRAWAYGVYNQQLKGVPFPSDTFPFGMLYRKDILDGLGLAEPKTADELLDVAKKLTDPAAGRWGLGGFDQEVRRIFGAPSEWRKVGDDLVHMYETDEFVAAVEFMRRVYDAGVVHPDVVANKQTDTKVLFESGKVVMYQDGLGGWKEMAGRQVSVNPEFVAGVLVPFAHDGGTAIVYKNEPASIFTFIRKGLGEDRVKELLGALNYTAAPYGTEEFQRYTYGVEGTHYTRDANGAPQKTALGSKEVAETYIFLGGRPLAITEAEIPGYVQAAHTWQTKAAPLVEESPFEGIRVERPSNYSAIQQPTEDKLADVVRGRRPVSEVKQIVSEWRQGGGDEGKEFYAKVLSDNGR
ncbi:MAG: extracellular solute-binding protein [Dactylosporangium sp.]|nr:extracellular solute-binding protein [Dactylosporangium sp.]